MEQTLRAWLENEVQKGGAAYVRNLAAAEAAVLRGQFNVAKILRAVAHSQRIQAMNAARLLGGEPDATGLFGTIFTELDGNSPFTAPAEVQAELEQGRQVRHAAQEILKRAIASLENNPDVLESDVAQMLWSCYGCGNIVEGNRPEICEVCGALAVEFEYFGPFYAVSAEHLGQLTPSAIIETLEKIPDQVAAAVAEADDETLSRKPSAGEWCAREIIGHMLETHLLFQERVKKLLQEQGVKIDFTVMPWKTHEGKGYEKLPQAELVERLRQVIATSLELAKNLELHQWSRKGVLRGVGTSVLDLATWVTNHDRAHLVQVQRLAGKQTT